MERRVHRDFGGGLKQASEGGGGAGSVGWASILIPLGLGFAFSLGLAWEALDANRRHRQTARAVARDQTQFAAYLLAAGVDRRMQQSLLFAFYPLDVALSDSTAPPPPPSALRDESELSRCEPELPADERRFFRLIPATGAVEVHGPDPEPLAAWVGRALSEASWEEDGFRHAVARLPEGRRLIVYRASRGGRVVYGFESCWRVAGTNIFDRVVAETQAFSPNLVGETPNDSLFVLAARYADGHLAYGERWTRPETGLYGAGDFYGTVPLDPGQGGAYGGLELRVTLLPRVAERLVEGGLPGSRLPLAVALLVLNGFLMWIAVGQLRRGHRLVQLRGRFVRNVSHELRTPLQQMLLFTELLRSGRVDGPEDRRRALDIMYAETRRLIELVRNLLRFSERTDEELRIVPLDLARLVRETVDGFDPLVQSRNARIEIEGGTEAWVRADAGALKRVLINLLDNAVKYGPTGQTVRVDVTTEDGWGVVSVTDQGPGIPDEEAEAIWHAFGRLERDEAGPVAGTGIGLAIVRRLVHAMEGQVSVRNGANGGAHFVVRLPSSDILDERKGP